MKLQVSIREVSNGFIVESSGNAVVELPGESSEIMVFTSAIEAVLAMVSAVTNSVADVSDWEVLKDLLARAKQTEEEAE